MHRIHCQYRHSILLLPFHADHVSPPVSVEGFRLFEIINNQKSGSNGYLVCNRKQNQKTHHHSSCVCNAMSIHYYRLIRKQAFNNPLLMYPHIQDVTAIMGKTVKNTGGVAALQKTDFSNPLKKTFHCVSLSKKVRSISSF